jgi:hypothetical protein
MKIVSHLLDINGNCSRCALRLNGLPLHAIVPAEIGDRIGVISDLKTSENSAYIILKPEHDSNQLCIPVAKESIP